ncbi:hypothetical protein MCOR25_002148 [Pyricularia grisea]|nr:hypothetical protein MCOR25_002148 [Pyricularia grisea]
MATLATPISVPPIPVRPISRTPYEVMTDPVMTTFLKEEVNPNTRKDGDMDGTSAWSNTEADDDKKHTEEGKFNLDAKPIVSFCDWKKFKNRFRCTGEPSDFVVDTVEVLLQTDDLEKMINTEEHRRMTKEMKKDDMSRLLLPPLKFKTKTKTSELSFARIRINSSIVLAHLAKISGNTSWSMLLPMTFGHPFAFFTHHQKSMKALLADLEAELSNGSDASNQPEDLNDEALGDVGEDLSATQRRALVASMRTKKASEQVRCYVEFVEKELMPYYQRFEQASHQKPMKIRFDDLWSLFRYGELVCLKHNKLSGQQKDNGKAKQSQDDDDDDIDNDDDDLLRQPRENLKPLTEAALEDDSVPGEGYSVLRLCWIQLPDRAWRIRDIDGVRQHRSQISEEFRLRGYRLVFDGPKYAPLGMSAQIKHFHGEKDIHKLPIFPIRFLKSEETLLKDLRDRGELFRRLISNAASGSKAMAYDGWTSGSRPHWFRDSEYLESDMIIETQEAPASNLNGRWPPGPRAFDIKYDTTTTDIYDKFEILYWAAGDDPKIVGKTGEVFVMNEGVDADLWNAMVAKDPFIRTHKSYTTMAKSQTFTDDDLVLLPQQVMAYALRHRKFFMADMRYVREIPWPSEKEDPFRLLRIDDNYKSMILSVVNEHFRLKELVKDMRRRAISSGQDGSTVGLPGQDFIRGKGQGLIILLHGAPGVGKTATAEAVAMYCRKPLFLITCGELGTTPDAVEKSLKEIFRLADLWECILLLDEADIFLSQRERGDDSIMRNAIVSVFLRTLEYYPGILFLTTNRVGVMDEAVKSRVHLSLHYPALDLKDTRSLFKINIDRLKKIEKERAKANLARCGSSSADGNYGQVQGEMVVREDEILAFAKEHFLRDESARWNGRQIRNAFQIAASLARYEQQHMPTGEASSGVKNQVSVKDRRVSRNSRSNKDDDDDNDDDEHSGGRDDLLGSPFIGKKHFKRVERATAEFERMRQNMYRSTDDQMAYEKMERPAAEYPNSYLSRGGPPAAAKPRPWDDHNVGNEHLGSGAGGGGSRETRGYRRNDDDDYSDGEDISGLGRGGGRGQYRASRRRYGNQGERDSELGQRDDDYGKGREANNRRRDHRREYGNRRDQHRNMQDYNSDDDSDYDRRRRSFSSSRPRMRKEGGQQRQQSATTEASRTGSRGPQPRGSKGADRRSGMRGAAKSSGNTYDSDKDRGDQLEAGDSQESAEEEDRRKGSGRSRR